MSLKAFHLFFIALSILLAFGFGMWGLRSFSTVGDTTDALMGAGSLLLGIVLVVYGIKVRRKLNHVMHERL